MSNQIKLSYRYEQDSWVLTSEVLDTSDVEFPRNIYLWTLGDDGKLDEFQAIGHIDQLARYPNYNPDRTSNSGVRLVKYTSSTQKVLSEEEVLDMITVLESAFDILLRGFEDGNKEVELIYPGD